MFTLQFTGRDSVNRVNTIQKKFWIKFFSKRESRFTNLEFWTSKKITMGVRIW